MRKYLEADFDALSCSCPDCTAYFSQPVQAAKRCEPCRSTGLVHCAHPDECGGPWTEPPTQPAQEAQPKFWAPPERDGEFHHAHSSETVYRQPMAGWTPLYTSPPPQAAQPVDDNSPSDLDFMPAGGGVNGFEPQPVQPAAHDEKDFKLNRLLGLIDYLAEFSPDKAERLLESILAKHALKKRLVDKQATPRKV